MFRINKWLYPGIRMKRWVFLFIFSIVVLIAGFSGILGELLKNVRVKTINVDEFFYKLQRLKAIDVILLILGVGGIVLALRRAYFSILAIFVPNKGKEFINMAYKKAKLKRGPKIAAIGGGTGLPSVLKGLKEYTSNLSAVVTVADDGGSSGRLRKDYQMLPPGDIRNCIISLADEEALLGRLFQYRFEKGEGLAGHNFGNIFITALTRVVGDFPKAVNEFSNVLAIQGEVVPVTVDNVVLKAKLKDGREITGQSKIPRAGGEIEKVFLIPENCAPYSSAINAIKEADVVIMGPGSLYTSIIPNLLVHGITEAMNNPKSVKIYICNIMTQKGETDNYTVYDHVNAIFNQVGKKIFDYVIVNNKEPSRSLVDKYGEEDAYMVIADIEKTAKLGVKVVAEPLLEAREYIRHSPKLLAKAIMKIIAV